MARDVFVLGGKRTPMGEYVGALKDVSAIDLGAIAARAALETTGVAPSEIDHTIIGNALQTSGDAIYGARHVALKAGVPFDRPALTVNRLCGSGIQSIVSGAQMIQLDEAQVCLVGGMESMSQAPHVIRGARSGFALGQGKLEDSLMVALLDTYCNTPMAGTADNLARKFEIQRDDQDKYALRSQQAAKRALDAGFFAEEIVKEKNLKPIGRIVSWAYAGVEPELMGIGPVPATRKALEKAGLKLSDMDLVEVNEAFAAQYLAVEQELGLDREITNVNGGAIALGHPLGATGTRLVLTLLHELQRRGGRYGLATACIGGGQGIAIICERV